MSPSNRTYVRNETMISVVINALISAGFAFLTFSGVEQISLWGSPSLALDFLPQTLAIAFFSVLVPTALTRKRVRTRAIEGSAGPEWRLPRNLLLRAFLSAVGAVLVLGGIAIMIAALLIDSPMSFQSVLALKIAYGAALALLITPVALRAALADKRGFTP